MAGWKLEPGGFFRIKNMGISPGTDGEIIWVKNLQMNIRMYIMGIHES
jgi:hypothetical protein